MSFSLVAFGLLYWGWAGCVIKRTVACGDPGLCRLCLVPGCLEFQCCVALRRVARGWCRSWWALRRVWRSERLRLCGLRLLAASCLRRLRCVVRTQFGLVVSRDLFGVVRLWCRLSGRSRAVVGGIISVSECARSRRLVCRCVLGTMGEFSPKWVGPR